MFDNDGCGVSRYYIGDPMHHEFHSFTAAGILSFRQFLEKAAGRAPAPVYASR